MSSTPSKTLSHDCFIKIVQKLCNKEYEEAINYILTLQKEYNDGLLEILHAYILTELERYTEAREIPITVPTTKGYYYYITSVFKNLNKTVEFKNYVKIFGKSEEDLYEACILNGDFKGSDEIGIKMLRKSKTFMIFSCLCHIIILKENKQEKMLELLLKDEKVSLEVLYFFIKNDLLTETVQNKLFTFEELNMTYFFILKELFIKGYEINKFIEHGKSINEEIFRKCDTVNVFDFLLDYTDDWKIYQKAINENIILKPRNSLNYKFYNLLNTKSDDIGREIIINSNCFSLILKTCEILNFKKIQDLPRVYEIFIENIKNIETEKLTDDINNFTIIKEMFDIYTKEKSLINIKILLSLLIGSRNEKMLILALYVSFIHKDTFETNYEIKLIYMFICRFFCFYSEVTKMFKELSIRNIQHENLCFLWSDLNIILNLNDKNMEKKYKNFYFDTQKNFNNAVMPYLIKQKYHFAIELLEMKKSFDDSLVFKEVEKNQILAENSKTMFSDILGYKCEYLFSKMTINSRENKFIGFSLGTIYNPKISGENGINLLDNGVVELGEDGVFIELVKDIYKYQETIFKIK
ncbi:hypothetical protein CWI38_1732p0010 [Hamiltosporidium tvaerminnensis]|uniref:Uncharacterized protein n=2 Tax=Hamiltosporidium tvaerminnensis TaxID=1176355 RepID=A0A4Q9LS19_9MICR|nr:hypothetical protein CWI38_1732p0010 [Hamiltosporidium tvaerminnensis]